MKKTTKSAKSKTASIKNLKVKDAKSVKGGRAANVKVGD